MSVQSVDESVVLLLNAGVYASRGTIYGIDRSFFDPEITAVNIALKKISDSGFNLPLFLIPAPPGHLREFFNGDTDKNDKEQRTKYFNYLEIAHLTVKGNLIQVQCPKFDMGSLRVMLKRI